MPIVVYSAQDDSEQDFDNDISIVKLKTPLNLNNNVRRACLPESSFVPQSHAVVSGWGTTVSGMFSIIISSVS